jgi:hypothetical protein
MKLKIKDGRAVIQAQQDWNEYNTKLARLMMKLKKDAGAESIRQNYKGTGSQKARRQLWVRFKSGAVIDLWIDMGYVGLGGVVTNRPPGSDVLLSTKRISYENKTPEQTYAEVVKVLNPWANPKGKGASAGTVQAGNGKQFQSLLDKNPAHKTVKLDPAMRKKVLMAIWKKYKQMGDGMMLGGKRKVMDAADGYATYLLEDMSDGELLAFGRWKGIIR